MHLHCRCGHPSGTRSLRQRILVLPSRRCNCLACPLDLRKVSFCPRQEHSWKGSKDQGSNHTPTAPLASELKGFGMHQLPSADSARNCRGSLDHQVGCTAQESWRSRARRDVREKCLQWLSGWGCGDCPSTILRLQVPVYGGWIACATLTYKKGSLRLEQRPRCRWLDLRLCWWSWWTDQRANAVWR